MIYSITIKENTYMLNKLTKTKILLLLMLVGVLFFKKDSLIEYFANKNYTSSYNQSVILVDSKSNDNQKENSEAKISIAVLDLGLVKKIYEKSL
jgi:hypothetical protein